MLIIYPRLKNGNVLWSCDRCGDSAQVCSFDTNIVALVCMCDSKVHPQCNNEWYYAGLYWHYKTNRTNRIPK